MLSSVQLLRFVAATMVAAHHADLYIVGEIIGRQGLDWLSYVSLVGEAGVHIFFVISGFIMAYTSQEDAGRDDAAQFMIRRLVRIFPIYWIAWLFYMGYFLVVQAPVTEAPAGDMAASLLLWPGYSSMVIGPGWTLSFELYFYLCFALVLFLPAAYRLHALALFFLASVGAGVLLGAKKGHLLTLMTNPLLLEFVIGACMATVVLRRDAFGGLIRTWHGYALLFGALVVFAAHAEMTRRGFPDVVVWGVPSLMIVLGVLVLEATENVPQWIRRWGWLGDFSYSLYLIHMLVLVALMPFLVAPLQSGGLPPVVAVLGLTVCALVAGWLLYIFFERPCLRWFRETLSARPRDLSRTGQV